MKKGILTALVLATAPGIANATIIIEPIASGFNVATTVNANSRMAGDTRVFVLQKTGQIKVTDRATGITSTFQDLSAETYSRSNNEHGLLGMTFDPNYKDNGRYYVFMSTQAVADGPIAVEVRRYTDPLIASEAPQKVWRKDVGNTAGHVGGWIDFDKKGKLLISIGDGGNSTTPDIRKTGQDPSDIYGSILRIDPHADAFPVDLDNNYAIPADNPVIPGGIPELYAYGVRNPFRNTVTPDGKLIIADVGQARAEELSILAHDSAKRNLGWVVREGRGRPASIKANVPVPTDYLAPKFEYLHSQGIGRAVIGGFVYRGTNIPELRKRYVFGDQVSGNIWSIQYTGTDLVDKSLLLIGNVPGLSSFGETVDGELLVTQYAFGNKGQVFAIKSGGLAAKAAMRAVPESGTWALMLAGLALCGGAMRSRRGRRAIGAG